MPKAPNTLYQYIDGELYPVEGKEELKGYSVVGSNWQIFDFDLREDRDN